MDLNLLFSIGQYLWLLPIVMIVFAGLAARPRQTDDGLWLRDHGDGLAGLLGAGYGLLVTGGMMAVLVFVGAHLDFTKNLSWARIQQDLPVYLMIGLFVLLVGGLTVGACWNFLQRFWTLVVAAPGELGVPVWPLPGGDTTALRYRRKLRVAAEIETATAMLVRYRRVGSGKSSRTVREDERPLGKARVRVTDGLVEATWNVPLPSHTPEPYDGRFSDFVTPDVTWQLEVTLDAQGLPDNDSSFRLRLGPGGAAQREAS